MKGDKLTRVLHVDDHPIVTDGIQLILSESEEVEYVEKVFTGEACLKFLEHNKIDIILLDINLPDIDGLELCKTIKKVKPDVKVLFLSMIREPSMVKKALKIGADGYVLKSERKEEILNAIEVLVKGGVYHSAQVVDLIMSSHTLKGGLEDNVLPRISRREQQILSLIMKEFTTPEIAKELFISAHTVDSHRKNLLMKLRVKNTAGLVRKALEMGLDAK